MQGYQVGDRFFTYLIDAGDYAVRTNQRVPMTMLLLPTVVVPIVKMC